jgi:hypothetical protein
MARQIREGERLFLYLEKSATWLLLAKALKKSRAESVYTILHRFTHVTIARLFLVPILNVSACSQEPTIWKRRGSLYIRQVQEEEGGSLAVRWSILDSRQKNKGQGKK